MVHLRRARTEYEAGYSGLYYLLKDGQYITRPEIG